MEYIGSLLMIVALVTITAGGFLSFYSIYNALIWWGMGAYALIPAAEKYLKIGVITLTIGAACMISSLSIADIFDISPTGDNTNGDTK